MGSYLDREEPGRARSRPSGSSGAHPAPHVRWPGLDIGAGDREPSTLGVRTNLEPGQNSRNRRAAYEAGPRCLQSRQAGRVRAAEATIFSPSHLPHGLPWESGVGTCVRLPCFVAWYAHGCRGFNGPFPLPLSDEVFNRVPAHEQQAMSTDRTSSARARGFMVPRSWRAGLKKRAAAGARVRAARRGPKRRLCAFGASRVSVVPTTVR